MVPTFYDSIEIKRDHMSEKFVRRDARFGAVPAFLATLVEFVLFVVLVRFVYRMVMALVRFVRNPRARAAGVPPVTLKKI